MYSQLGRRSRMGSPVPGQRRSTGRRQQPRSWSLSPPPLQGRPRPVGLQAGASARHTGDPMTAIWQQAYNRWYDHDHAGHPARAATWGWVADRLVAVGDRVGW